MLLSSVGHLSEWVKFSLHMSRNYDREKFRAYIVKSHLTDD